MLPSVYLATFFLSLHYSIGLYVDSSYLAQFFGDTNINVIYFMGSLATMLALIVAPKFLRRFGNYTMAIMVSILEIVSLLSLALVDSPFLVVIIFVCHVMAVSILSYNLDIFIEHGSENETTGETRGLFLTIMNLAVFFGPISAGFILSDHQFWKIYVISAILILPALFIIARKLSQFCDPEYKDISLTEMFTIAWKNKNIRYISIANFLLQFFYSWMIIYMAIYLSGYMHFKWEEIGLIFGIMLLPFIFLQFPLGEIADRRFGEKEILVIGFLVTAFSTASLSFLVQDTSILIWATILFITRVGAAAIEIMTETYFFKQIEASEMCLISFFRHTRPLSFITGTASASIFLYFFDIQYLFVTLGVIMLSGIYFALQIEDTM
ncbi:MAG: MFS transporter [Candidatus Paceibacterota bacterium]|nr:MFS transporter [Candidatus Paceibacterota bacterium]